MAREEVAEAGVEAAAEVAVGDGTGGMIQASGAGVLDGGDIRILSLQAGEVVAGNLVAVGDLADLVEARHRIDR